MYKSFLESGNQCNVTYQIIMSNAQCTLKCSEETWVVLSQEMLSNPVSSLIILYFNLVTKDTKKTDYFINKESDIWFSQASSGASPVLMCTGTTQIACLNRVQGPVCRASVSVSLGRRRRVCIFHKLLGDADAAGVVTTLCQCCLRAK